MLAFALSPALSVQVTTKVYVPFIGFTQFAVMFMPVTEKDIPIGVPEIDMDRYEAPGSERVNVPVMGFPADPVIWVDVITGPDAAIFTV